jgi:hypothetical protein
MKGRAAIGGRAFFKTPQARAQARARRGPAPTRTRWKGWHSLAAASRSIVWFFCGAKRATMTIPVKGLTGVLVFESGKLTTNVSPTPEEVEEVRADLERHRALSKKPTDITS